MRTQSTVLGSTLALLLSFSALVFAQQPTLASTERPGSVYASVLFVVPRSQGLAGDGFQSYVLPPGGSSVGWSALAGVFVAPRASLEFDVARSGILKRTQHAPNSHTFTTERRDTFFTTAIRLHLCANRAFDIEPVMGFDVVLEEKWTSSTRIAFPGRVDTSSRYKQVEDPVGGLSFGADLSVGNGRAIFVASFRLHRTFWADAAFGEEKRWTFVPGVGVGVRF